MAGLRVGEGLAVLGLVAVGFLLLKVDDVIGPGEPPPEDYFTGVYLQDRPAGCDGAKPVEQAGAQETDTVLTGAGGDTVILSRNQRLEVFDIASPRDPDRHDTLILVRTNPATVHLERSGPHLLICGDAGRIEAVLIRQYCRGADPARPWNNEIEEIAFPLARETWLSNDLYDHLSEPADFPPPTRVVEVYGLGQDVSQAGKKWRVRPFREVLPSSWWASIDCRRHSG
jgi:hypothetical protein